MSNSVAVKVSALNGFVILTKVVSPTVVGVRIGRTLDEAKSPVDYAGFRLTRYSYGIEYVPTVHGVGLPGGLAETGAAALDLITRLLNIREGKAADGKGIAPACADAGAAPCGNCSDCDTEPCDGKEWAAEENVFMPCAKGHEYASPCND